MGNLLSLCEAHEVLQEARQRLHKLEHSLHATQILLKAEVSNVERLESDVRKLQQHNSILEHRLDELEAKLRRTGHLIDVPQEPKTPHVNKRSLSEATILRPTKSKLW